MERVDVREGRTAPWPAWVPEALVSRVRAEGIDAPWAHQAEAAEHARAGRSVIIATGTASGKSLAYLMPAAAAVEEGGTVLYLAPTKALAADQLRALRELELPGMRAAGYDGDTPFEERAWVRRHADYVLTNPDMLHHAILPQHRAWASMLRRLRYVVVDESHRYRGVFGSHVAALLRRLRRVCARYRSEPVFVLASATIAAPGAVAERLVGLPVREVTADGSPRGGKDFVLWEPPLTEKTRERGAPVRRPATAEAAELLAELAADEVRTLAFVRSRRGAESVALEAGERLAELRPGGPAGEGAGGGRIAAYRAGYLASDRRRLEAELRSGELLGLATTNALELGVDISGLDAVLITGWPGTRASLWQQAGRAGRDGRRALAVFIARDDPLDTYLVHHPDAVFGRPVETTVFDPDNPYVLGPHLCAAAAELPVGEADLELFGPAAPAALAELVERGLLRRRSNGWYWTRRERASDLADLRGSGGTPVQIVEADSGVLLGSVDAAAAHSTVHEGAVYLHQGETYLVRRLDLDDAIALVEPARPPYSTWARGVTRIEVAEPVRECAWGEASLHFGTVRVTDQVVAYQLRDAATGTPVGEEPLDLPPRTLHTRACWWTVAPEQAERLREEGVELPGAAHAAEHASIGLLPLFATCDRWDIGGVSTEAHPDTGRLTVFVYDGQAGGAGFAERGYLRAADWLRATRALIADCECPTGCPSCIQSPKCGNGNEPLDKSGALRLLDTLLAGAPDVTTPEPETAQPAA
ncbi:DEAD/DEAH box helicase [Allonocardiopsis opalescens]|uniref:DEAD/DEAH box helicase n=1 Tax=Allonocardiopsis opalescens TaxID=1144618 RepID=UPI001FEBAFAB